MMYESYNPETTNYYSCNGQHVHELIGSTDFSQECDQYHNHRFAAMSGEAIPSNGSHFHNVTFRTDTHEDHFHEFCGPSSLAIPTGDGRHIHFANGCTKSADGHVHRVRVVSLINNPTDSF